MNYKTLSLLGFVIFSIPSIACDICGNYMGITPYDNKNSISFLHRYRVFNGYKDYQNQSYFFPSSAYKVAHGNAPTDSVLLKNKSYSSKDFESYKIFELRLKYFIVSRLELNVFLPIANNKSLTNGVSVNHTGFGDVSANVAYHFITPKADQRMRHKLIVGLGIKLPTGNFQAHDANNTRLPFEMQTGTGGIDGFSYINYTFMAKHFGANLTLNYKLNGTNSYHERLANSTTNFVTIFYKIPCKKMTFYPSLQANYECSKGLYINRDLDEDSQVNSLLVGPGLDIYYKSVSVNASWQFTAIERVNSGDLKSSGRITLGVNYSFGKREKK